MINQKTRRLRPLFYLYYSGLGTVRFLWQVDIIVCSKALVAIITVGTGGLWSVRRGVVVHSEDLSLVAVAAVAVVC